jgi:hypothetical protein
MDMGNLTCIMQFSYLLSWGYLMGSHPKLREFCPGAREL